jgi:hypothetical protein
LNLKTFRKILTEDDLIKDYFSNVSRENQWTAIVYFLYEASYDFDMYKSSKIFKMFLNFFEGLFFNWTNESSYIVDAMALRILWDFSGFNVFKVLEEKEKQFIISNLEDKSRIEQYALHMKYSLLKCFMMMEDNERNIEDEIIDWIEKIGGHSSIRTRMKTTFLLKQSITFYLLLFFIIVSRKNNSRKLFAERILVLIFFNRKIKS